MLFVRFHRKLNFWAIFAFLQYFTHFGRQKRQNSEGKIAPWYMAWHYIKLIQWKNRVSSSNNYNQIFGLLKMQNFTAPDKRGIKVKNTPFLVTQFAETNQQCAHGNDNRPVFWQKIVTIPDKKLLSINICLVYWSGCLKLNLLAIIFWSKIQNPHVSNGRGQIQFVNCNKP